MVETNEMFLRFQVLNWLTNEGFTWWSSSIRIISELQGVINLKDETNATRRSNDRGVIKWDRLPHTTYDNLALLVQRSLHII
jgi:hypothetical protein